jgi:hypothetical protein
MMSEERWICKSRGKKSSDRLASRLGCLRAAGGKCGHSGQVLAICVWPETAVRVKV